MKEITKDSLTLTIENFARTLVLDVLDYQICKDIIHQYGNFYPSIDLQILACTTLHSDHLCIA